MKKCPFCAEDIQDQAVVCKHCKRSLTPIPQPQVSVNPAMAVKSFSVQQPVDWKKVLKIFGAILLVILSFQFWYITIPGVAIWYLWRKAKFSKKTNIITTASLIVVFAILEGSVSYANRAPTLAVLEPANNYSAQAPSVAVKGKVNPTKSSLTINSKPVQINGDGSFSYNLQLPSEKNTIAIVASNGGNAVSSTLIVNRIFTDQEKADLAKQQQEVAAAQQQADLAAKQDKVNQFIGVMQKNLKDLQNYDSSAFRGSIDALSLEAIGFSAYAQIIDEAKTYDDPTIKQLIPQMQSALVKTQAKEFPAMRQAYTKVVKQATWENNVDVSVSGRSITFTGALFASHKNIETIETSAEPILKDLRFNRVNYKWYEYDDNYTYYDLDTPADTAIIDNLK